MRSQANKQPADSKETYGGSNKSKGSNSPSVSVTVKHQPGKTVPAGSGK